MPVRFLSDAQREQLSGFPAELEPESACDEDWCRILGVMAHGDLLLVAITSAAE